MLFTSKSAAINGETILKSRPQKLASPAAVPRIGAGNTSGVHPYRTALNIDWKKYSYAHDNVNLVFLERELGSMYRPKSPGESLDHMLGAGLQHRKRKITQNCYVPLHSTRYSKPQC